MKVARVWAWAMASMLLAGLINAVVPASASAASPADCGSFTTTVNRLVKPSSNANLLTQSASEATTAAERYGFTEDQGPLAQVASTSGGLTAIWRLYRAGDFAWAAEGADRDKLVAAGYTAQFVNFYAATEASDCLSPVYRFIRGSVHRMATSGDVPALTAGGWTEETVAFYAKLDQGVNQSDADTKFSIAVIPDTQNESNTASDARFNNRATWLADNKASLDLRYAMQVGDLVNWGNVAPAQFTKISNDVAPLEDAMPWAGAIGNHDTAAVCVGGSACPGVKTSEAIRDTQAYNTTFPPSRFPDVAGTFEDGKIDNAYRTFSAGGRDWMVLTLELWPRSSAISWARQVVSSHPRHNVIVVTHAYLEDDGSIGQNNGGYGATSPQYLYDHLVKVYPNVKVVLSGHVGQAGSRVDTGTAGNKVVSLSQTFHSSTNPVRLVEIDTAAGTMTSRIYAPGSKTDYPQYATSTAGLTFVG